MTHLVYKAFLLTVPTVEFFCSGQINVFRNSTILEIVPGLGTVSCLVGDLQLVFVSNKHVESAVYNLFDPEAGDNGKTSPNPGWQEFCHKANRCRDKCLRSSAD